MQSYNLFDGGTVKFESDDLGIKCIIDSDFNFPKNSFHVFLPISEVESMMDSCKALRRYDNTVGYMIPDAIMFFAYKEYYEETRNIINTIRNIVAK
jgi:hypothetical protein